MLWDALGLGMRALLWSADVAVKEEGPGRGQIHRAGGLDDDRGVLAIAVAVFFFFPTLRPSGCRRWARGCLVSMVEGVIRLWLFLLYLLAIGFMPDIRRVFAYHGAEHKTINAYEAGSRCTLLGRQISTAHTRCGTSFLLSVMVISVIVFAPFHFDNLLAAWRRASC